MIQFNLLPDVKKKYIKAKQTKRLIISSSVLVVAVSLVIVGILFSVVQIAQKKNIKDLTNDITSETASLQSIDSLNKILTIQNQLEELPALHEAKPETSRLFSFLSQLTPAEIKIRSVQLDIPTSTLVVSGSANSLASVNRFADTLKFATYNVGETKGSKPFSSVITSLNRDEESATYEITIVFDPILFDNTQDVTLVVPEQITTRSTLGKPNLSDQGDNSLFDENQGDQ